MDDYDGGGKIFEAFLMLRLKHELEALGVDAEIRDCRGQKCSSLLVRGSPGNLKRRTLRAKSESQPGHIHLKFGEGSEYEIHNSVEWPDHLVSEGERQELDVSIALKDQCDTLADWYSASSNPPSPLLGVEAKFRWNEPDKELARAFTGLAAKMKARLLYLITSAAPSRGVRKQVGALVGKKALETPILDADAFAIRQVGGFIDTSGLARVAIQVTADFE